MSDSTYIPIDQISIRKDFNPRSEENPGLEMQRMSFIRAGICEHGLDAALIVTEESKNRYNIVAGERRYRSISKLVEDNVTCFDPISGTMRPARDIYIGRGVECKIRIYKNEVERKIAAIQENVLHEPLGDYELLEQLRWLQNNGVSVPAEQGKILARCVAWISQSHSLLEPSKKKILEYIKAGKLSRTAALNFINIPDDKIESVLEKAMQDAIRSWESRVDEAAETVKTAADEIGVSKAVMSVASFMGDPNTSTMRSKRKDINSAKKSYTKSQKILDRSATESPTITDTGVIKASRSLGAADGIHKPRTAADLRKKYRQMKDDQCADGLTDEQYQGAMAMARWLLDCSNSDNLADLLEEEDLNDTGSD